MTLLKFFACSVASEVVSVLDLLGKVSGVDHTVLGLTLLAWGNSLGDLSTNVALARSPFCPCHLPSHNSRTLMLPSSLFCSRASAWYRCI